VGVYRQNKPLGSLTSTFRDIPYVPTPLLMWFHSIPHSWLLVPSHGQRRCCGGQSTTSTISGIGLDAGLVVLSHVLLKVLNFSSDHRSEFRPRRRREHSTFVWMMARGPGREYGGKGWAAVALVHPNTCTSSFGRAMDKIQPTERRGTART
jgi:hypothetical protein